MAFRIVRFFADNRPRQVIRTGLTEEDVRAHCKRDDTRGDGWFDGWEECDSENA